MVTQTGRHYLKEAGVVSRIGGYGKHLLLR